MSHKSSGLWCDLCGHPIILGYWWHIGINRNDGHAHEDCKQEYDRKLVKFKDSAEFIHDEQQTPSAKSQE